MRNIIIIYAVYALKDTPLKVSALPPGLRGEHGWLAGGHYKEQVKPGPSLAQPKRGQRGSGQVGR
jgi:hypothetical protein